MSKPTFAWPVGGHYSEPSEDQFSADCYTANKRVWDEDEKLQKQYLNALYRGAEREARDVAGELRRRGVRVPEMGE